MAGDTVQSDWTDGAEVRVIEQSDWTNELRFMTYKKNDFTDALEARDGLINVTRHCKEYSFTAGLNL